MANVGEFGGQLALIGDVVGVVGLEGLDLALDRARDASLGLAEPDHAGKKSRAVSDIEIIFEMLSEVVIASDRHVFDEFSPDRALPDLRPILLGHLLVVLASNFLSSFAPGHDLVFPAAGTEVRVFVDIRDRRRGQGLPDDALAKEFEILGDIGGKRNHSRIGSCKRRKAQ